MTANYHTPLAFAGPLTSAAMEAPLSSLDTQLSTQRVSRDAAAAGAEHVAQIKLVADTTQRAFLGLDASDRGSLAFGPGGTAARDTSLFRSAVNTLRTDSHITMGTGRFEINGGFTNGYDTSMWLAPANRANPTNNAQAIYAMLRMSGDMGARVHDGAAFEIRLNAITNATFLNALETSVVITGGANTIADTRAITGNIHVSGTPTGTVTNAIVIASQTVPAIGTLVMTNVYGLYVEPQTVGGTNWSIYAPTGASRLGIVSTDGDLTVGVGTGARLLTVDGAAGTNRELRINSGGLLRWIFRATSTAEGGANAGSDLNIIARDDAGANIGTALVITRSNLAVAFGTGPLGFFGITPVSKRVGWAVATGTATRTTFATDTVTLIELARRVKALIDDLHNTAGYGLISA